MWKTRRLRPRPAGSPEAPFSARSCLRLPRASASLGQSAAWAALAGHIGLVFNIGFMVQLNELSEFTGGGTRFSFTDSRPSSPLSVPAGHAMLFSGRFNHEGANLTAGARYLLVGFVHYAAPVRSMDSFSAHLLQDGAHACSGSVNGAYKTGSHFNYEQLRRASGAKSGGHLVHMLAANHASMPNLDPRSLQQLSIWCRRWLRVNATLRHVKKAGPNTRHQGWYRRKMQQMPLEVHAFMHHAIGWQLTTRLREQPRARLRD